MYKNNSRFSSKFKGCSQQSAIIHTLTVMQAGFFGTQKIYTN